MSIKEKTLGKFESISEIIADKLFVDFVYKGIKELKNKRSLRPEPEPGYHYKRTIYDRLIDEEKLNGAFFINNIEAIWTKTSDLSSQTREIIKFVCDRALTQTLLEHAKQRKTTENETANS